MSRGTFPSYLRGSDLGDVENDPDDRRKCPKMTTPDYIPATDAALLSFATNYSTLITATPTTYGLVAGDATATAGALTAYSAALALATNPATRTSVSVTTKDVSRATLVALIRSQVAKIQGTLTVTNGQKTALGITVRKTTRTPIPAPTTRPLLTVVRSNGPVLDIRLNDELTPDARAYPFGVIQCQVFMFVGVTPGVNLDDYTLLATVGRSINSLDVTSVAQGAQMTFISRWVNRRGGTGPQSDRVTQIRTV